ncbi:thermonuclease family protein [Halobaculum magnesiiphilum]|uniref:Thermonuclease family protein n=1 Tax=Halobaculum magnesiiphilum TaxID=1017351 RepID=A0A8T8WFN1_9EURY|nr:thermonuclease family protein [Halobaculum magnesiiphilum]QZP38554.1 thermonuclease family protein [Halobaculum magnesiiphilum]
MRRRNFLGAVGASAGALAVGSTGARAETTDSDRVDELLFDSTASLLAADGTPAAADADFVAVRAEPTAVTVDEDGDGDAVEYPDDRPIPLAGVDGDVVAFGAPVVQNGTDFLYGNEEVVLNALDRVAGSGTVAFDETHGQFYDADAHTAFIQYAELNGYAFEATGTDGDFAAALSRADAAVVTSPSEGFSDEELDALAAFVADGGGLLLFDQSDFGNFDATDNLNEIAGALDLAFRFNDDQVIDGTNNAGVGFVPTTTRFDADYPELFADRKGLGFEVDTSRTYTAEVVEVTDGDTVDVRIPRSGAPDYFDTVRLLGIDTPETTADPELPAEWEGIDSIEYLLSKGEASATWARGELSGATVDLSFDPAEGARGDFGRLLCYLRYDADGDGSRDDSYNRRAVAGGYARVYDSGLTNHDAFIEVERTARERGLGVWEGSDPDASAPTRPSRVEKVLFPRAAPIEAGEGAAVVARAGESASVPGAPLAAVDEGASVALVGAQTIGEDYDGPDAPVDDPDAYDAYQFTTGVVDDLTARAGEVLIDGGHGQFAAEESVSAEDAAYFQRYLEGLDTGFTQYNELASMRKLTRGRAVVVSAPTEDYADAELAALRRYARGGGAVVVLAGRAADRERVNGLLDALDADLALGAGAVDDASANAGRPDLPVTNDVAVEPPVLGSERDRDEGKGHGRGRGEDGEEDSLAGALFG